ncbi:sulfatase [Carboxylicivirga mesophila]|uniref:Sulfatase n=1 Tax=Carboxylicivirga mesophila TaxID=1166478 RepID=A0ABS5KDJ5_9BACT|nr:sulfatase [Carboxylicivirga mesophila]MBS2213114.1 sulfatase [Carboxylicivirga mesophila]
MQRIYFITLLLCAFGLMMFASSKNKPNVLFITVDDMNWNSIGAYGCQIPEITPHIDRLAEEGMRFEQAYVQASNCSPSRSVFQTSRYPHQSGMRGFFYVEAGFKTLPEVLKESGYITGVINKSADSSLSPDFEKYWDVKIDFKGAEKRSAISYGQQLEEFLSTVEQEKQAFYCVVNVADPHKPFFNDAKSKKQGFDAFVPSKVFSVDEVDVPAFLPDAPKVKQEVLNYYNSVKRGDDCVGAILEVLKKSPYHENTIVIFVSDHGMPLPFAKSSVYPNGIRTQWIVAWPGEVEAGAVNTDNMISAIDFMPTVLDMIGVKPPSGMEGQSFYKAMKRKDLSSSEYVFAQFDENAGGVPRPSRTVLTKKYGYVFNAWATGKYPFKCSADAYASHKYMKAQATSNQEVKERYEHWVYRSVEELYDYEKDPDALHNLIDDPACKDIAEKLRQELESQMQATNDYVLSAFKVRDNLNALNQWMQEEDRKAIQRAEQLRWKRHKNRSGATKGHTQLYQLQLNE